MEGKSFSWVIRGGKRFEKKMKIVFQTFTTLICFE